MRATTGGHAVVLPCPQCARTWSTEQTLAGHLMDTHGMDASPAVARAMQVAHEIEEDRAMSKQIHTCSKCGSTDHNVLSPKCPEWGKPATTAKACGYCHRADHLYADCPTAKARRKGKKRAPTSRREPTPSHNGFAGALTALRVERAALDQAIVALERLEARER